MVQGRVCFLYSRTRAREWLPGRPGPGNCKGQSGYSNPEIRVNFIMFFGTVLGAKQTAQRKSKWMPRAPKTFPGGVEGPSPKMLPKTKAFLSLFEVPGTLKIELSPRRELNFHFFTLLRFWTPNGSKNGARMVPESARRRSGRVPGAFPKIVQKVTQK